MSKNVKLLLVKNAEVYSPKFLGKKDILIAGNKIIKIDDNITFKIDDLVTEINLESKIIIPGIIDVHMHVLGGGGESGPTSRTPESNLSELINSGITTIISCLGTDSISRSLESLYLKIKELEDSGLTTYMYTGSYRIPTPTLTGSIEKDLILIDKIIGIGEIAISDHRGSYPSKELLLQAISEARRGAMIGNKPGIVHCHIGSDKEMLNPLWEIVNTTGIPITQFHLTHINRNEDLLIEGIKWLENGGYIDLTIDNKNKRTFEALNTIIQKTGSLNNVTVSSDAYGSFPKFDEDGELVAFDVGKPDTFLELIKQIKESNSSLEQFLQLMTTNPAKIYNLRNKGSIVEGKDADLLILNANYELEYVIGKGKIIKSPNYVQKGKFES